MHSSFKAFDWKKHVKDNPKNNYTKKNIELKIKHNN